MELAKAAGLDDGSATTPPSRSRKRSNAAVHGNRLHAEHPVHVKVQVSRRRSVEVEVSDLGPGFDATQIGDPTHPARVLMPGGRGIFLMRQLVDRVEYNETGNSVRLLVERKHARSARPPRSVSHRFGGTSRSACPNLLGATIALGLGNGGPA